MTFRPSTTRADMGCEARGASRGANSRYSTETIEKMGAKMRKLSDDGEARREPVMYQLATASVSQVEDVIAVQCIPYVAVPMLLMAKRICRALRPRVAIRDMVSLSLNKSERRSIRRYQGPSS